MQIGISLALGGQSGLPYESLIRSLSPAAWFRPGIGVTGTLASSNWADQSGNTGRDLAQATGGNQPIILPFSGTAYGWLPGVAGNYFSTPDSPANSITGDIDIRVNAALNDWSPAGDCTLVAKWSAVGNFSYIFNVLSTGALLLAVTDTGNYFAGYVATSTTGSGISDGAQSWVRVTRVSATGKVNFYKSSDGATWTPIGVEFGTSPSTIYNGTSAVSVGMNIDGSLTPTLGKIYRAQIFNGINGTLAVDFNPADFAGEPCTNGATAVSSGTGETWTLNSTGAKPAQIVKSASLLGDGTNHKMVTAGFTRAQPRSVYMVYRNISWTLNDSLTDGLTASAGIYRSTSSPKQTLYANASAAEIDGPAIGSYGIVCAVFNGALSLQVLNNGAAATGDAGAASSGGITVFDNFLGTAPANIQLKEFIDFPAAHDASTRAMMQSALNSQHGCY